MGFVEVNGIDIHYVAEGEGPPLVFLHGFGSCAEAWYQQFAVFGARFRCIAYDSVNHGHSANSPAGQPEPDRADELEGFLAALGIESPIVAGNSMGALTLLRWATRHPDRARALVPSGMGVMSAQAEGAMPAATRRALTEAVGDDVLFLPGEGGFTESFPLSRPLQYQRYIRLRSTATRLEASRRPRRVSFANPGRDELAGLVASISSPMQVIVGEKDWLAEAARQLHALVPGSHLEVIPGAPHNVYYETAEQYNSVLARFLADVPALTG
ncbi:MAG TPA: alpha/beta hydrolase [Acidimicrobiales bacterium]|nr:alpha/beta hydrolase [Acidimicrobiales bacterium]